MAKRLVVGLLVHVDAGKTTLSEAMLYRAGNIRRLGRVDHGDAFLDTDETERRRGITIMVKPARLRYRDLDLTILDTPGHVDFAAGMERALSVLDYVILVMDARMGPEGYTDTLWRLLDAHGIPTFLFVNKTDAPGADPGVLLEACRQHWSPGCLEFGDGPEAADPEDLALLDEGAMDEYLEAGYLSKQTLKSLVARRLLFPAFRGSALHLEGIDALLDGLETLTRTPKYNEQFGARVYRVSHDRSHSRLTWLKVTGGDLPVKTPMDDLLDYQKTEGKTDGNGGRIDQLRLYSGDGYLLTNMAHAGDIVAATGLEMTYPGEGLGVEPDLGRPALEPVLTYAVRSQNQNLHRILEALKLLQDEEPMLHVSWVPRLQQIQLQIMGPVELEVIREELRRRFGLEVDFNQGEILYRETIQAPVEGVGHFEPLRHYAEVHLLLEPTELGSGLSFASSCSRDRLDGNWQRLIMTHLQEKEHLGVLTGSPITDMRITLLDGRAHLKHTEGGDFRQATYRAIRQGLMKARSLLLEPWYRFRLSLPRESLGHAMSDIARMGGQLGSPHGSHDIVDLEGRAPVSYMRDYAIRLSAYTHGQGHLSCSVDGYRPCHDQDAVVADIGYDPEADLDNTPDSVFCAHGAGYTVKWNRVEDFMHLPSMAGH